MTRARLTFPQGDPIEFPLDDVTAFGPDIGGFRAWLGAVFASAEGRWIIRFADDEVLGFRREELKKVRATPVGAETCMYTTTADETFILERRGRIVIGSPCSGHGFKFAPAIGSHCPAVPASPITAATETQ